MKVVNMRNYFRLIKFAVVAACFWFATGCKPERVEDKVTTIVEPVRPKKVETARIPTVKFVDVTKESGINFVHVNGAEGEKLLTETMGSGVAFFDYDGDGDQDLFFVNSSYQPNSKTKSEYRPTHALYRNDGKGKFQDVTKEAGLDQSTLGMGVATGDYDDDGDIDLYVSGVGGGVLFRNDGKGKFEDVTKAANARGSDGWQTSVAFLDIENDGDLDLFICCYVTWSREYDLGQDFQLQGTGGDRAYGPPRAFPGSLCTLLRNDQGVFKDISEEAGITVRHPDTKTPVGKSLGVAPFDLDGDGLVDIAVANDTVQNFVFHNKGGGKFEEIGITSGVAFDQEGSVRGAMGIDVVHFKNDESVGIFISNFANEMTACYVAEDPKGLQFSDQAAIQGLGAPTSPPMKFGLFLFDYDLDGRLDLLTTNGHLESDISKVQASETYLQSAQLFWNTGESGRTRFALVGAESAGPDLFRPIVGRGSAYADIDGDGDLDVVLTHNGGPARIFRNDGGNANKWLRMTLRGTKSNRQALGAKITLKAGDESQHRQVFTTRGYLSSSEPTATFGLGKLEKADSITIVWPSGKTTELKDLKADKSYLVDEDQGVQ